MDCPSLGVGGPSETKTTTHSNWASPTPKNTGITFSSISSVTNTIRPFLMPLALDLMAFLPWLRALSFPSGTTAGLTFSQTGTGAMRQQPVSFNPLIQARSRPKSFLSTGGVTEIACWGYSVVASVKANFSH